MRKTLLIAAAALMAGLLTASAQNVYSVNIVGFVNRPIQGNNQFTLLANPLNAPTNTYEFLLRPVLPPGSAVLRWTGAGFSSAGRVGFGTGWAPSGAGTNSLAPGEAVFVQTPVGSPNLTNTFVGEVMLGNFTNNIPAGFSLIGNVIADGGPVTALNFVPPAGTAVIEWMEGVPGGGYLSSARLAFAPWWSPSVPTIDAAQGFFVSATAPFQWVRVFTNSP